METDDQIGYIDTMLQYYLGIQHPEALTDAEWATKFKQLTDIRKREAKARYRGA